jgi:hypothetical protein
MVRRSDAAEFDRPLSKEELAEHQRRLSLISAYGVAEEYRRAHEACRMDGDELPRARAVQELVTAWKVLWGWRDEGRWGGIILRFIRDGLSEYCRACCRHPNGSGS